jgi:hypothetical protein
MTDRVYWPLILGLLLGGLLLLLTRNLLLIPVALLVVMLPPLAFGWYDARRSVREWCLHPPARRIEPLTPGSLLPHDEELRQLGYQPAQATLHGGEALWSIYLHEALPIYALALIHPDPREPAGPTLRLETFFEGGRLTTLDRLGHEAFTAAAETGGPRLVQLRDWGPGTPTALDGQHVGTLKPWIGGKRRVLPARTEELVAQLQADEAAVRSALQARGWVRLGDFVRAVARRPWGVLKF